MIYIIYVLFLPCPPLLPAVFQSAGVRPGARVGKRVAQPSLILLNLGGFQGRTWPGQKRKEGAPPLLHFLKARRRGRENKMEKRNSGKRSLEQSLLGLPRPVEEGDSWSEGIGFCSAFSLFPPFQSPFFYIGCGNSTAGNGGNKILFLSALFHEWPRAGRGSSEAPNGPRRTF